MTARAGSSHPLRGKPCEGRPHAPGEYGDQGDADEELGDGDAELAERREPDAVGLAVTHGGVHAERDRRRQRDGARGEDQRCGDRQLLAELAGDGRVGQRRAAEVAGEHAAHPLEVLVDERAVEAELLADRVQPLRRRLDAADDAGEVTGQKAQQQEDDHAGDEHGDDELAEAAHAEPQHSRVLPHHPPPAVARGRASLAGDLEVAGVEAGLDVELGEAR